MTDCTITKSSGDTESDGDNSSFYGVNSALVSTGSSSILNISGGTVETAAKGCNSIFATNSGTINCEGMTINNTKDTSRGMHATYEGVINATNMTITTAGQSSSVIATDRGGGTVTVNGGTYTATGYNSAVTYSTGTISVTDITGLSAQGEIGVIEGNNSIEINNCDMTSGSSKRALMILQSGSGDSEGYNGEINVTGGSLTLTGESTPLLEVPTNMTGTLTLTDVTLTVPSGRLMYVDYNTQWSTYGGTGNLVLQTASSCTYSGDVAADSYSTATVTVGEGVTWYGAVDTDNTAKSTTATINSGAIWVLSANTYLDTLVNNGTIYLNGYTLTVSSTSGSGTQVEGASSISSASVEDASASASQLIYSLSGSVVGQGKAQLSSLPSGVYVMGGKKIVVR